MHPHLIFEKENKQNSCNAVQPHRTWRKNSIKVRLLECKQPVHNRMSQLSFCGKSEVLFLIRRELCIALAEWLRLRTLAETSNVQTLSTRTAQ